MKPQALKALKDSIAHWERMATDKRIEGMLGLEQPTGRDCPLCQVFCANRDKDRCMECPVAMQTGHRMCARTPYQTANDAWHEHGIESEEFKQAAQIEVEFLRSLLPKEEEQCPECSRSYGPHYTGPCEH